MNVIPDGRKVFMFLKLQFLEGKARGELFKKYPPKCVYVSRSRILCAKNGNFEEMKAGKYQDGAKVLRARIDMSSPNINMRDPVIYRVAHMTHHNTRE